MRKCKLAAALGVMCLLTMATAFQAAASLRGYQLPETTAGLEQEAKEPAVIDGVIHPRNLEAAAQADQLIVVVGTGGCDADIFYYTKQDDNWNFMWKEEGYVGRSGITAQKAEGDGATPAGTYSFNLAFGLMENPGSILPYHQIRQGDFWVDDPKSLHYNQLVNTQSVTKDWNSAENLIRATPYYNYALNLDYNKECTPGKGSAIFLHCFMTTSRGSSGCICLPQDRMIQLLQSVTEDTKIVISPDLSSLK